MQEEGLHAALEHMKKALAAPLAFAVSDQYAHIGKLAHFYELMQKAVASAPSLPEHVAQRLLLLAKAFDEHQPAQRINVLAEIQQLLTPLAAQSLIAPRAYLDPLLAPIKVLPYVGPKKAAAFAAQHIHTIRDLLNFLPRSYVDRQSATHLDSLQEGQTAVVTASVVRHQFLGYGRSKRLDVLLKHPGGYLKLIFFHFTYFHVVQKLVAGEQVTVIGQLAKNSQMPTMIHPKLFIGEQQHTLAGIWPNYPDILGISPNELSRVVGEALVFVKTKGHIDPISSEVIKQARLCDLMTAYHTIHQPSALAEKPSFLALNERTHLAFRRMAFEELLAFQLNLQRESRLAQKHASFGLPVPSLSPLAFLNHILPFTPTKAQVRAVAEIIRDMARSKPMARMLQGDVGAGKTAVAFAAMVHAVQQGYQCALMAPTEILAQQHFEGLQALAEPLSVQIGLLTGSTRVAKRREILADLAQGRIQIIIGTHALLSDDVEFSNLGLYIVDEQHRFGVEQRAGLRQKTEAKGHVPHLLVMTATPIPRSLALTLYGDLALSVLDELPPGRTPVKTKILRGDPARVVPQAIRPFFDRGEKIYVVYPLVEESEKLDLLDATTGYAHLQSEFGEQKAALLHGRMKQKEKDEVMRSFAKGDVQILVSTTVVEVGVNVPEATCMVVMHAERFGLSQLHQLRGRVGRSHLPSSCFLVSHVPAGESDTYRRLHTLEESNDGFHIANVDLEIRGPGDFLGTRQAGLPVFFACDLTKHADIIEHAREMALRLLEKDPDLKDPLYATYKTAAQKAERS